MYYVFMPKINKLIIDNDLPIGPFHCAKFKKILTADPELWGCTIFEPKMVHLPITKYIFWKIINIILIKILKKNSSSRSRVLDFFRKPINEPCFFHSCLSTYQKSKSDINLLVKYWLKNTEIALTERHFWLLLENQIFSKHAVFAEC